MNCRFLGLLTIVVFLTFCTQFGVAQTIDNIVTDWGVNSSTNNATVYGDGDLCSFQVVGDCSAQYSGSSNIQFKVEFEFSEGNQVITSVVDTVFVPWNTVVTGTFKQAHSGTNHASMSCSYRYGFREVGATFDNWLSNFIDYSTVLYHN